jgi:hypothetical protein
VKEGTGFFNQLGARVSTLGDAFGINFLGEMGREPAEARSELQLVQTLGAASLADSDRYAVTDISFKRQLFTDPDAFLTSPEVEYRKLQNLKGYLEAELVELANDLRNASTDESIGKIRTKMGAAKSALSMMSTIKSIQPEKILRASGKGALDNF